MFSLSLTAQNPRSRSFVFALGLTAVLLVAPIADAFAAAPRLPSAPEPTTPSVLPSSMTVPGPLKTRSAEYKFAAGRDTEVLKDRDTEIWAKAYWPENLKQNSVRPIVFVLHGNHPTCGSGSNPRKDKNCDYTLKGTCPAGQVVVPNHEGYGYLAEHLASHGYIVVSINSNRGISCGKGDFEDAGLILARGRLVLKHIELWKTWAQKGGAPKALGVSPDAFKNAVDLANVGLMGHSRGGEGMRAALALWNDSNEVWRARLPDLKIKAIFEIGGTDDKSDRTLDAIGVAWTQLLPLCDGDVADLPGRKIFNRMLKVRTEAPPSPKSLYMVWGANHNFFNTEWQENDSQGCTHHEPIFDENATGSRKQQEVAVAAVGDFFRAHVGQTRVAALARHFDPSFPLPESVSRVTKVERDAVVGASESVSLALEEFTQPLGINSNGASNHISRVKMAHVSSANAEAPRARVAWEEPGRDVYVQLNWTEIGSGRSITDRATLDFRVSRAGPELNLSESTDFSVHLVHNDDSLSTPVSVKEFASVHGPFSGNLLFQTVRIPLKAFTGSRLNEIRGVRFVFDKTESGALLFANVRVSAASSGASGSAVISPTHPSTAATPRTRAGWRGLGR